MENVKKALLILNPKAGKMKLRKNMFNLVKEFCENGYAATVMTTLKKGDAVQYARDHAADHDICVCCGGDGTLNEVITGLFLANYFPPLAFIPSGSTNDMARTLELPTHIRTASKIVFSGSPSGHDVGLMNGEYYFSYICSFGAFTKVSYRTPQWAKNIFGHGAYIMDGITEVGKIHPYTLKVNADGREIEGEFLFGSVSNARSIAGILKLHDNDVDLNDGKFELLLVRNPQNPIDVARIFDDMLHKRYDNPNVIFTHASHIEFDFAEGSEASFTTDGEFAGKHKKAIIENLHGRIKIIQKGKSNDVG